MVSLVFSGSRLRIEISVGRVTEKTYLFFFLKKNKRTSLIYFFLR